VFRDQLFRFGGQFLFLVNVEFAGDLDTENGIVAAWEDRVHLDRP
jgi:hypothetical protein